MGHVAICPSRRSGSTSTTGSPRSTSSSKAREADPRPARGVRRHLRRSSRRPDREGEAIAWHLAEALGLSDPTGSSSTRSPKLAVDAALAHPRKDRPFAGRRTGGAPGDRPPGRIPALAAAVAQGACRTLRRSCNQSRCAWVVDRETTSTRSSPSSRGPSMLFLPRWQQPVQRAARGAAWRHRCRGSARSWSSAPAEAGEGHRRARARRQGCGHRADAGVRRASIEVKETTAPPFPRTRRARCSRRELTAAHVPQAHHGIARSCTKASSSAARARPA